MEAVNAAMGRGHDGFIELRNREPLKLGPKDVFNVISARGTLDIRAAAGTQPIIELTMDPSRPFLATGSSVTLVLSGLTILVRYPTAAGTPTVVPPPVIQAAGRVQVERCAFEVVGPRPDGCRVLVAEGSGVTLKRCWLSGFDRAIQMQAYGDTTARVEQTMIVPGPGTQPAPSPMPELRGWALGIQLMPGAATPEHAKRRLTLDHCTIEGTGFLDIAGDAGRCPLPVEVMHCAVRAEALVAWEPLKPDVRFQTDVKWEGLGNHFQIPEGRSWIMKSARTMTPAESLGVTDMASWSDFAGSESSPILGRIRFQTDPRARPNPPQPQDLAIESSESGAARAARSRNRWGPGVDSL